MQASTELKNSVGEIIGRVTCQKRVRDVRAVDRGGFVQLLRNALEPGQEDDHHVAADGGPQRDEPSARAAPSSDRRTSPGL